MEGGGIFLCETNQHGLNELPQNLTIIIQTVYVNVAVLICAVLKTAMHIYLKQYVCIWVICSPARTQIEGTANVWA